MHLPSNHPALSGTLGPNMPRYFAECSKRVKGSWKIGDRPNTCQCWIGFLRNWGVDIVVLMNMFYFVFVNTNIPCYWTEWWNMVECWEIMSQAIPMGCLNGIIKMTLHSNVELANSMGSETNMTPLFRKVACRFVQLLMPTWGGKEKLQRPWDHPLRAGK